MHKYRYFISYAHTRGFGNQETRTDHKITDINDVGELAREIEENRGYEQHSVVILNFQRFED